MHALHRRYCKRGTAAPTLLTPNNVRVTVNIAWHRCRTFASSKYGVVRCYHNIKNERTKERKTKFGRVFP